MCIFCSCFGHGGVVEPAPAANVINASSDDVSHVSHQVYAVHLDIDSLHDQVERMRLTLNVMHNKLDMLCNTSRPARVSSTQSTIDRLNRRLIAARGALGEKLKQAAATARRRAAKQIAPAPLDEPVAHAWELFEEPELSQRCVRPVPRAAW